jgi:hypothetical protein
VNDFINLPNPTYLQNNIPCGDYDEWRFWYVVALVRADVSEEILSQRASVASYS